MSRGPGRIQQYLLMMLYRQNTAMTFTEIKRIARPHEDTYRPDLERSMRRALKGLVDREIVLEDGKGRRGDPCRYRINPTAIQATIAEVLSGLAATQQEAS